MPTTMEIGQQLVEMCRQGKHMEAINAMYSRDVVSIEPVSTPAHPARQDGLDAIRAKNKWWVDNHTVHSSDIRGPYPHGDRFVVFFRYDATANHGPMAGQRFQMEEAALYTIHEGKIIQEEFFYQMGP